MSFNVDDLYENNFRLERFHFFVFVISATLLAYYGYLIIKCSNKNMKIFKTFMIIYISSCFLNELIIFLWKPIRIYPHSVIYPMGLLHPMSAELSGIFVIMMMISIAVMVESIFVILLERHFKIVKVIIYHFHVLRFSIYGIQFVSFCLVCLAVILCIIDTIHPDRTSNFMVKEGLTELLRFQPSLLMFEYSWNFLALFAIVTVTFYFIFHAGILFWLLYHNFNYSKNIKINPSKQSKKQFSLMLQNTIAQTATLFTFGLPCLIWLGALLLPETPSIISSMSLYLEAMATMYPIFDVMVVVSTVKPYRVATVKLFRHHLKKIVEAFILKSSYLRNSLSQNASNGRNNITLPHLN